MLMLVFLMLLVMILQEELLLEKFDDDIGILELLPQILVFLLEFLFLRCELIEDDRLLIRVQTYLQVAEIQHVALKRFRSSHSGCR